MVILFSQRPSSSRWCRRTGRKPRLFSDAFYLILAILLGWVLSSSGAVLETTSETRLYVDYSAKPSPEHLAAFNLCILDPEASVDLEPGHAIGHRYLAYLSVVEAREGSKLSRLAAEKGVSPVGKNKIWGTAVMDVLHPAWLDIVVGELAHAATVKGYDGFFLDTLDSIALLDEARPDQAAAHRAALISLVKRLRERHPDAPIVINRGFELLPEISPHINGVLVESVYRTCDPRTRTYSAVVEKDNAWLVEKIRGVQRLSLPVYAVDYVPETDLPLAKETAARLAALGCIPFVTTIELKGVTLAPLCEVSRRVLVLYGAAGGYPAHGTFTSQHLQPVLEWLGCEVTYQDVLDSPLPDLLPRQVAGVILDPTIELEAADEIVLARGLAHLRRHGKPVLILGRVPFSVREAVDILRQQFGIAGTMESVSGVEHPRVAALDGVLMRGEAPLTARALDFRDIQAPSSARVLLSVRGQDREGREVRYDPVFLTSWGAAWLTPYVITRTTAGVDAFQADACALLSRWLGTPSGIPVPDTTTLDGRRVFFSQVHSDGFVAASHFPGHPTCAEVLRDRIFSVYPLPTTVALDSCSVMRQGQDRGHLSPAHHENIARTIFTMPHLEAALEGGGRISTFAEITAGLQFINNRLLTGGKSCRLLLWPDRPEWSAALSASCDDAHIPWMGASGGLHASDADHTREFSGLYKGGYENVIASFERSGAPRRLAPVNLRYHFRSGSAISSVRALEQIHAWCMRQPLHPVTAHDYARMRRDADGAKIFPLANGRWLVTGAGHVRTWRLPADGRVPDMRRSEGVSGWKQEGAVLYVHTHGKQRAVIALTDNPASQADQLRLQESGADILFHELQSRKSVFGIRGWAETAVTFAGIQPGAGCRLSHSQDAGEHTADPDGTLSLKLAPHTTYTLEILPPSHAASL